MDEALLLGELVGGDVGATIRDKELQFGRQQDMERRGHHKISAANYWESHA